MPAPQVSMSRLNFPLADPSLSPPSDISVPFEGVEKRLIVFFSKERAAAHDVTLPSQFSTEEWQTVLDHAHCEICSVRHLGDTSVYLLSESTLTVWPTGFLMKTCGRTTPFLALRCLIDFFGLERLSAAIDWLAYSRLDFLHPQYQVWPHQNFLQEQEFLTQYFPQLASFQLPAGTTTLCGFFHGARPTVETPFRTEEALLLGVNRHCVESFTGYDHQEAYEASDRTAPGSVIRPVVAALPKNELDEHWFSPCGYSCNALAQAHDGDEEYFSCHISPEAETAFASLELTKSSLRSAFPVTSPGLAFFRMIPAFEAREVHATVISVENGGSYTDDRTSIQDAAKALQFNLTKSSEVFVSSVGDGVRARVCHLHFVQDRMPLMLQLGLLNKQSAAINDATRSGDETSACSADITSGESSDTEVYVEFSRLKTATA